MRKKSWFLLIAFLTLIMAVPVAWADVDVYAEGAYTQSDLAVFIYADITSPADLRSAGVRLTYDTGSLQLATAERNNAVWYLGTEDYNSPEISQGVVIFILGKLDTENPSEGVGGSRVLLGKVLFNRTENSMPPSTPGFGISLDYGKRGPEGAFANFVDTQEPANVLDDTTSVSFLGTGIFERGDVSEDGIFTSYDMILTKRLITENEYRCYADCNSDGVITTADMVCIKGKI